MVTDDGSGTWNMPGAASALTTRTTVGGGERIREKSAHPVSGRKVRIHFYGRVLSELPPERGILAALTIGVVAYGLGHGALALAAGLLGRALARHGTEDPALWAQELISLCTIGLVAAVVKAAAGTILEFSQVSLSGRVGTALRTKLSRALLASGLPDAQPRVLATIAVRVREVEAAVTGGLVAGVRALAQIVPLAGALIFVSPRLAIGGALVLAPFAVGLSALRRRWRRAASKNQLLSQELHAGVDELVRGLDLWRSYGAGRRMERVIAELGRRATRSQAIVDAARAGLSGTNEVLAALALLGSVLAASWWGLSLGDGTLVAFAAVFFMAYRPLRDLGDARAWTLRGSVALEVLDAIAEPASVAAPLPVAEGAWPTAMKRLELVDFGAADRGPRTSLAVDPGEIVCVVGPTGSGKTTLLRALLGLEPAAGTLRYGERDLTDAGVGPTARPFAWVPQDAPLITGSVLDNVALFGAEPAAARAALEAIGAGRLLERADEVVGPGGRPLSGGERRQVAIARALASGSPVLLLDEPTEGLDPAAERQVLAALAALAGERSLIVVTHREPVCALARRRVPIGQSAAAAEQSQNCARKRGSFSNNKRMSGIP